MRSKTEKLIEPRNANIEIITLIARSLAVGWVAPDRAAEAILPFLGSPDTLVVVSSDLSHYLPQTEARRVDDATIKRILALRADIDHEEACGATGVNALLLAAGQRGLRPHLLGAATSADTIGDPARVVGLTRSEERRVGKECRSRWSPYH